MPELTNLLPSERVHAFSRNYFMRVVTMSAWLGAFLLVIHGALLIPTYVYLLEEVETRKDHLETLTASVTSSEEQSVEDRLTTLTARAERLLALTEIPPASAALLSVLAVSSPNVRVTGISTTPSQTKGVEGTMRVTGVAATREALRNYHQTLSALPFVSKADLPLSVYAEESDIAFSIAITGTLTP